jgi:hypothetical protein
MVMESELKALQAQLSSKQWRMENLYLILDEEGRMIPFVMRSEQRQFMLARHNRNFIPKARKLGMSTWIVISNLDDCIFNAHMSAGIIDLTKDDAFAKLGFARFAWANGHLHPNFAIAQLWTLIKQGNPLSKDAGGEMQWANGSKITAGVAFTGRTPQRLHISEYGPISAKFPAKATGIKRGAFNSLPPGGIIDIETTMEGGQWGECYNVFQLALEAAKVEQLTALDWQLHFFPWWGHPSYTLPGLKPSRAETTEYFAAIEKKHGIKIPLDRQAFYEKRKAEQGEEMWQQFPTVIDEVDRQIVPGQIYPELKSVRAEKRVVAFPLEKGYPLFSAWDLGSSDNMAGALIQPAGKAHNFHTGCVGEGAGAAGVADVIRAWEMEFGPIQTHFLPHDCEITDKGSGKTYLQQLVECGIPRKQISVVPRIPDTWVGIDEVRRILPHCWFHVRMDEPIFSEMGAKLPSLIGRLEGYRKKIEASTGIVRSVPVHDLCSHFADSVRTYAEALSRGLVKASVSTGRRSSTVIAGFRGEDQPTRKRGTVLT